MASPTPTPDSAVQSSDAAKRATADVLPSPLRCFGGAILASALAFAAYLLTASIADTFAHKPVVTDSNFVLNISLAVRTLVVGVCSLATFIFGFAAFGLVGLGTQVMLQRLFKHSEEAPNS